ncbi:uncharacterized protein LOC105176818 [Sesamum indicum]|uniref:Uncharacterized protein LOC105176818 n=1 Tax=Sesamum indicum TaxID=4182 RepID=A0A6I9UT77_SESIN|nr:uncharacterized protein LOC105176818 [Sesamum indicum]
MQQLKFRTMLSTAIHRFSTHLMLPLLPPRGHRRSFSSATSIDYQPLEHHPQWSGLHHWRRSPLNHDRYWGPNGPIKGPSEIEFSSPSPPLLSSCSSLAEMGAIVLSTADPLTKAELSHLAYTKWRQNSLPVGVSEAPPSPARPPKPQLVSPKEIPPPKSSGLPLNAYLLHNLAHVELNAIDLAWDTVVRFSPYVELLGEGFFADFAHVADDESRHFSWCLQRLEELGVSYGDMPAHSFLWRECDKSSDNVAARLAVIPLVQEARGLDAGPRLVNKLIGFGDHRSSNIVAKIADEEIAHVAVGVYWFVSVCQKMGRAPGSTFTDILEEYGVELKGPFNYSAREEAGIPREWYDPSSTNEGKNKFSEVYDRLACIISMEKENSSLGKLPK